MKLRPIVLATVLSLISSALLASDEEPLDRDSIVELVSEQTVLCRREKDQSLCSTYFSEDGVIKRMMHDDGARRDGVWFVDDQERLCILWKGKIKPACFGVYPQADGSHHLIKREKHVSTILDTEDGNTKNL